MPGSGAAAVGGQGLFVSHAKLVALQAGGDVGVGSRVHIGVHTQADVRGHADFDSDPRQHFEFSRAFHIEALHAGFHGHGHLGAGLANARENTTFDAEPPAARDARQFTGRDDVKAAACLSKGLQHGQIRVGLHGIANQVGSAMQRF